MFRPLQMRHAARRGGRNPFAFAIFEGKRAIQRHQAVYATLGTRMHTDEVHALSMKTLTPAEWATQA